MRFPVSRPLALLLLLTLPVWSQPPAPGKPPKDETTELGEAERFPVYTDITGKEHRPGDDKNLRAVVFVFVSIDCPIANFYQPTLRRLAEKFEDDGVLFLQVHPDPDTTTERAAQHARSFGVTSPVILDPAQAIARKRGATITPEAVLVTREGTAVYRGRIDNTYSAFGKRRPKPTSRDLTSALEAVLAGRKVKQPITQAIGCHIFFDSE